MSDSRGISRHIVGPALQNRPENNALRLASPLPPPPGDPVHIRMAGTPSFVHLFVHSFIHLTESLGACHVPGPFWAEETILLLPWGSGWGWKRAMTKWGVSEGSGP